MAELFILQEGYFYWDDEVLNADSTIVLVKSDKNIIIETGGRGTEKLIAEKLAEHGLTFEDISLVINTHNHPDHVWNNYLFKNADIFEAGVVYKPDGTFRVPKNLDLAKDIEIMKTPGHTPEDFTVLVTTEKGVYAVTGDLIMSQKALESADFSFSHDAEKQKEFQKKVLERADFIVPGHGKVFKP